MSELSDKSDIQENPEEGYPVAPLPPGTGEIPPPMIPIRSKDSISQPPARPPFQYTLADMFALTAAVAAFMSIVSLFPLATVAGASGLGALISLILLALWPPEQPLLRLGWWVLFVLYLLTCIGAMIFGR